MAHRSPMARPSGDDPLRPGPYVKTLRRLDGRTALVTGATGGIGLWTAVGLADLGATVWVTGRNQERGDQITQRLRSGGADVRFVAADVSTLGGVRELATFVAGAVPRLDILVNNAGSLPPKPTVTADGFEVALAVNHLAPFLLTALLRPRLRSATGDGSRSRVVNVTSSVARFARFDPAVIAPTAPEAVLSGMKTYGPSKVAALIATLQWARRLDADGPVVHAADPGGAATAMTRDMTTAMRSPVSRALFTIVGPGRREPVTAARSSLVAATAPAAATSTGRWVTPGGRITNPPRRLTDDTLGRLVWDRTATLLGFDPDDVAPPHPTAHRHR